MFVGEGGVCLHVCVCVCVCVSYLNMSSFMCVCVYLRMCLCAYVFVSEFIYLLFYACVKALSAYLGVCVCACVCVRVCVKCTYMPASLCVFASRYASAKAATSTEDSPHQRQPVSGVETSLSRLPIHRGTDWARPSYHRRSYRSYETYSVRAETRRVRANIVAMITRIRTTAVA